LAHTVEERLRWQEGNGVGVEIVYPTDVLWAVMANELPESVEVDCVRRYNDWLSELATVSQGRLMGVAQMPSRGGVDLVTGELQRCVHQLRLRGAQIRDYPNGTGSPSNEDDEFWSAAAALAVPISLDATFGPVGPRQQVDPGGEIAPTAARAVSSLTLSGVFDREPGLRIVVVSPTAGWIPPWLERSDDSFLRFSGMRSFNLARSLPSDYFRDHIFYTVSGDDLILRYLDEYVSSERVMWASYYPTTYSDEADAARSGLERSGPLHMQRVMRDNCGALYGMEGVPALSESVVLPALPHAVPS
jgi:predicted TIM-barrel fold metal-dependent hydrolase